MNKDLIIGETSQLAYFWDKPVEIMSSRNIDVGYIKSKRWNRIYNAFSEGRTFLANQDIFKEINVEYTLNLINEIKDSCENLLYYSTTELWNQYNGAITIDTPFCYDKTSYYIKSKEEIVNVLLNDNNKYKNVIILFPFSFNSAIRKEKNFLFSKIFYSIVEEKPITVGDLNFYRELLHPKFVVEESQKAMEHKIIGSGRLVHVGDFIERLYQAYWLESKDFLTHKKEKNNRGIFYLKSDKCLYSYSQLYFDTLIELDKRKKENETLCKYKKM